MNIPDALLRARPDRIARFTVELSSACNLRCMYCHQSIEGFTPMAPMSDELFEELIAYCRTHGIKRIDCTGGGEATFAPDWRTKVDRLLELGVELSLTTNMARLLNYDEMTTLSRFAEITMSIDTVDREILRKVRKAEDVRTLVYNFAMMRAAAIRDGRKPPHTVFCMVLSAEVIDMIDWLGALANSLGVDVFLIQDVMEYDDIAVRVTPLWKLRGEDARRAGAALDRFFAVMDAGKTVLGITNQLRAAFDRFRESARTGIGEPIQDATETLVGDGKITHTQRVPAGYTRDCMDPWRFLQILSDGSTRPCCSSGVKPQKIGEAGTLDTITNSELFRSMRNGLLSGDLHPDCQNCSLRSHIPIQEFRSRFESEMDLVGPWFHPPKVDPPQHTVITSSPNVPRRIAGRIRSAGRVLLFGEGGR